MPLNRRRFLQNLGLGTGVALVGLPQNSIASVNAPKNPQLFNMCGFKAPKIDKVKIGIIGLGNRGPGAVKRMTKIEGVEIVALCDKEESRVIKQQKLVEESGLSRPKSYTGVNGWKTMCDSQEIDLVYICTPWSLHVPMAVYAMNHGKHTAIEVPAAKTIDECWQLVETSEKTRKHCMMLENCCYDFFEQLTLNMARNGMFGDLVHAEGAYIHNLLEPNFKPETYSDMWRLRENATRNGNLYPTHGLGPIAQCMDINRGDRFDHLVSISSNDFQMAKMQSELIGSNKVYDEFKNKKFRGNMNTTIIKTVKGRSIMLQHDVTSTRPYSRIHLLSGTKGVAQKWPDPARLSFGEEWMGEKEYKEMEEKYTTPLVKHIGEIAKSVGGHGGMDFIMDWRLIDCLRNGLALDQDVYDAAAWSAVAHASEMSVASRGRTVDIPDFTRGKFKTNIPVSLSLDGGANTQIRK